MSFREHEAMEQGSKASTGEQPSGQHSTDLAATTAFHCIPNATPTASPAPPTHHPHQRTPHRRPDQDQHQDLGQDLDKNPGLDLDCLDINLGLNLALDLDLHTGLKTLDSGLRAPDSRRSAQD